MTRSERYAIATLSLGSCELHKLEDKLHAAASAGFPAVELFLPDWHKYLELYLVEHKLIDSPGNQLRAAQHLRTVLDSLQLRVNCLQPLRNIEGTVDPVKRRATLDNAVSYFPICKALDIDLILCCSSSEPDVSSDVSVMSRDLVELADLAAQWSKEHGGKLIRIGFEGLSWGTHVNTWKQAWQVVSHEPRENLGIIIDSFNSLAREYADPYTPSGLQRSPSLSSSFLKDHLKELTATVPGDKIYLFQVADAGVPEPSSPLSTPPSTDSGIPRLQPWSRNCRLFPLESSRGAFLPVAQYAMAVLATGYKGDLSLEVFNVSLHKAGPQVPEEHAARGIAGLRKLDKTIDSFENSGFPSQADGHDLLTSRLHHALSGNTARRPYVAQH